MVRAFQCTTENGVAFIFNASWDVSDGFSVIQQDRQDFPGQHRIEPQFGFDKIVRTDDPSKIQRRMRFNFLIHVFRPDSLLKKTGTSYVDTVTKKWSASTMGQHAPFFTILAIRDLLNGAFVEVIPVGTVIRRNRLVHPLVHRIRLWGTLPARSGTRHHAHA